jgi:hypothetical protein
MLMVGLESNHSFQPMYLPLLHVGEYAAEARR